MYFTFDNDNYGDEAFLEQIAFAEIADGGLQEKFDAILAAFEKLYGELQVESPSKYTTYASWLTENAKVDLSLTKADESQEYGEVLTLYFGIIE